jgi:triosephosphate isomerase
MDDHPRRKVFAANWKMNLLASEAQAFFATMLAQKLPEADILIFPPALYLAQLAAISADSEIAVGAQNIYWEDAGAFTGEISASMIKDLCVRYALCGHSERRHIFGESSEMVTRKARAAQLHGLTPVICVGETLQEKEAGETLEILHNDTLSALAAVEKSPDIIIAYEPVWAIGTGLTATPADAEAAIAFIRNQIAGIWGDVAQDIRILYGGSVNDANIADLISCPNIDGALIGGASLHAESFLQIIENGTRR